ncbi:DnaJ domain-containing protein [Mucilaginibacter agri]|uniref:DnaJ domain-containing protein n=1 Tax=Mucilaginibacter agri TaxID=2695265 RepID=A0A966DW67_9SPHI|nr:DnaJ domain-containing protein [Mucilaginibacter agri]NCD71154.1 DnaJ domain-containing protein [Mucilaginibacter agri]
MKDFYYILGTDSRCTPDELNEAYRKLSQKLAPALGEEDYFLQSHFKEITEAYEILSDPIKRKRYDEVVKKTHKKQLANFKAKNLGIVTVGALILFTALFGFYVVRLLSANGKSNQPVAVTQAPIVAAVPTKIQHHKKKHHAKAVAKAIPVIPVKKDSVARVAVVKPPIIVAAATAKNLATQSKIQPVVKAPPVTTSPTTTPPSKSEIVITAPITKVTPSTATVARTYAPVDSSYTTYLKPTAEQTYLHQQADYMSNVLTVLPNHSKIKVLAKGSTFYKISYNDQIGYIPRWTIIKP